MTERINLTIKDELSTADELCKMGNTLLCISIIQVKRLHFPIVKLNEYFNT